MSEPAPLGPDEMATWETEGYVLVRGAISAEQAARGADEVWEFAGKPEHRRFLFGVDRDNEETWYEKTPDSRVDGRTVEIYHGTQQWANRTAPDIYGAFSQILGERRICCSLDAAHISPPSRNLDETLGFLHWDMWHVQRYNDPTHGPCIEPAANHNSAWETIMDQEPEGMREALAARKVQGMLYLTDTPEDTGAFVIVPGFHRQIESWLKNLPASAVPSAEDLLALGTVQVPGNAGDLVIWNSLCPHSAGVNHNREGRVRVVQYLSYRYDSDLENGDREARRAFHRDGQKGNGNRLDLPNEPGNVELTSLGRKIAGLDPWP